jgi:hypothetical protein
MTATLYPRAGGSRSVGRALSRSRAVFSRKIDFRPAGRCCWMIAPFGLPHMRFEAGWTGAAPGDSFRTFVSDHSL